MRHALTPATIIVAVVLVIAIASSVVAWRAVGDQNDEIAALRRELESNAESAKNDAASSQAAARDLSVRVGSLEAAAQNTPDPAAVAHQTEPSVFTVETEFALGSAWVAASTGGTAQLVTNYHVIAETHLDGGNAVKVRRGDQTYDATIIATSAADDLAVLSVAVELPVLAVEPTEPKPGDAVLVAGSPLGLEGSVSSGIVSAVRTEEGVRYIQFTAPISPGNSGGPVLDAHGKVIGVAVAKAADFGAEGLGFAIPTARVCASFEVC